MRNPIHKRNLTCSLLLLASHLLIGAGLLLLQPIPALANNTDMSTVIARYPQLDGTRLDSCDLCHTSTRPCVLNGYGQAFKSNRSQAGLTAIESLDSDGDGHTNIDEINALTFPGNVADFPTDMVLALLKYPALENTRLDTCDLCHTTGSALNSYGLAYNANGRNLAAFAAIEALDSDGDTYANLAEIDELTFPGNAADHPAEENADMLLARQQYPALVGTRLDSCELCHTTGSALNQYGHDYQNNGRNLAAFAAIEALDSDSDSYGNLVEITALTFPGSATDYPIANTADMDLALQAYPALADTRLDTCTLCHTSGSALNSYGLAYNANGRNLAAFALIQTLDSDGDGHANLTEINLLTFPGSAADMPADMDLALVAYPQLASTRLDTCDLCHNSDYSLNPYGEHYNVNGRNLAAFNLIELLDSDGDGFGNLDEITGLTFPGDAADYPDDLALALQAYPHLQATDLNSCTLCHTADNSLNGYGLDYRDHGRNLTAFTLIENLDSDNDGHPNLDELTLVYFPGDPIDYPAHMELLLLQYPNLEDTELETCTLCHTADWALNPYGADYQAAGNNRAAFNLIEELDSDGDGALNIEEINALTMPGSAPVQEEPAYKVFVPLILK